ncbi:hypothetical protein [Klebsiella sp. K-Nf6]|uniref:hypothetical protein n=1 Tax=Klebsiella sp. K-Nf6 TaxID=2054595 RepID=UPI00197D31AC|nr:hypothetical protein [Klebsiella sp. K-Nf6]
MTAPPTSMKCCNIAALKAYLAGFPHKLDYKPNGQSMYGFDDGLTLNVYDTGSVVFQGAGAAGLLAVQIANLINLINKPINPQAQTQP